MLKKYFDPISNDINNLINNLLPHQIGKNIAFHHSNFPEIDKTNIVIIGFGNTSSIFRKYFYQLSYNFKNIRIVDLGNIKPTHIKNINKIFKICQAQNVLPIIISKSSQIFSFLPKRTDDNLSNLIVIDKNIIPTEINQYKKVDQNINTNFNLSLIGYQSYYMDSKILQYFTKKNFDYLRLGLVKTNIALSEPIIRDADFMNFNLAALKKIEIPNCTNASPSGLFVEEACQLTYYAGISDKMSLINIHGYDIYDESNIQTAQAISQMVWYFIFGYYNRKYDYPVSMDNFREYIINFKASNYQVTFWKSTKSDRWWMEIPIKKNSKKSPHLVPCSYEDYIEAGNGNLPERLLNSIKKFQ